MDLELFTAAAMAISGAAGYCGRAASDYVKRRGQLEDRFADRIAALESKLESKDLLIDQLQVQVLELTTKVRQLELERDSLLRGKTDG